MPHKSTKNEDTRPFYPKSLEQLEADRRAWDWGQTHPYKPNQTETKVS